MVTKKVTLKATRSVILRGENFEDPVCGHGDTPAPQWAHTHPVNGFGTPLRNAPRRQKGVVKTIFTQNFLQTWLPQLSIHWYVPNGQLLEVS